MKSHERLVYLADKFHLNVCDIRVEWQGSIIKYYSKITEGLLGQYDTRRGTFSIRDMA